MLSIEPVSKPVMKKIAVFIGKSLLAQGALSYLRRHPEDSVEVCSLNVFNPQGALEELKSFKPDIVIIESQYLLIDPLFSQSAILKLFPDLIILELHVDSPAVQIIRSEQRQPSSFEELIFTLGINRRELTPVHAVQQV